MKATLKGKNFIIELPLQTRRPSTSGKSMVVGSSCGVRRSAVKVNGKTVYVTVNAFCYPDEREGKNGDKSHARS
jgi:hypothetical protein